MENAADALKLGAWVLIFVAALTITINAFGLARQSIDGTVQNIDREYITTYVEQSNSTQRVVGIESIIPAIYRAYKDNYKIIFPYTLYKKINSSGDEEGINYIDIEKERSSPDLFIKLILFGSDSDKISQEEKNSIKSYFPNHVFNNESDSLMEKMKNKLYKEELGVYYQEETKGGLNTPNANKTEKRVITYTEKVN